MFLAFTKWAILLSAVLTVMTGSAGAADSDSESGMRVLVVGASGRTGRLATAQLMRLGIEVRAMTRDVERAKQKAGIRFAWVKGDVSVPESLTEPLRGVSYVIAAMASSLRDPTNTPESVDHRGMINLVDAAAAAGVNKIILISSMGVTRPDSIPPGPMQTLLRAKLKGEDYLRTSGIGYTVIRPGGLTDEPGNRKALALTQGDQAPFASVSRADVARVAVECLTNDDAQGKTFELTGAQSGDPDAWLQTLRRLPRD